MFLYKYNIYTLSFDFNLFKNIHKSILDIDLLEKNINKKFLNTNTVSNNQEPKQIY